MLYALHTLTRQTAPYADSVTLPRECHIVEHVHDHDRGRVLTSTITQRKHGWLHVLLVDFEFS